MPTTPAFRAVVISKFHRVRDETLTYVGAKTEEEARRKLRREGYEVVRVWRVQLTHLGGEKA